MTEAVAELVLKDNYEQTETLSLAEAQAASMLDVHARFMRSLEQARGLDRELEALPDDEEIAERKREHRGLTRPGARDADRLQQDRPLRRSCSTRTCPRTRTCRPSSSATSRRRCPSASASRMRDHRLRREITATQVVNNMLHGGGTTFAFRLHEETGRAGLARSRAPTRSRARCSRCGRSGRRSRRSTTA